MPVIATDAARKRWTLVACILGSGIVLLDGTVVNVALPTIQRALGGGLAAQQWVVNGYLLTLGSLILIGGSLGDLFGERRVFAMYAGLAILFFFLILFLQQIGGYTPLKSGLATLPVTIVMFVLSRRFGALADKYGPRFFMGAGPLLAAAGLLLFQRVGVKADYVSEVLPPLLVFSLGLAMTVAPLTAAVLAGSEHQAGIASGVNNAIARVAGLLGTASVGAVIAASFAASMDSRLRDTPLGGAAQAAVRAAKRLPLGQPDVHGVPAAQAHAVTLAAQQASLHSFHLGMMIAAALVALGGVVGVAWIRNPQMDIHAATCEGGALVGASPEVVTERV